MAKTVKMKHKTSGAIANPVEKDLDIWLSKGWLIDAPKKEVIEKNNTPRFNSIKSKG